MKQDRRHFLKTAALTATGLCLPTMVRGEQRPNVLFIAVDDLRPQLGCYGHKQMISPNIDHLASEGIRFDMAFCQVPVCGASRASLLTGVRPTPTRFLHFDTWADKDLPGALSLPRHFRENGYYTLSNGKVYHHREDDLRAWSEAPWRPKGSWKGRGYLVPENLARLEEHETGLGPAWEKADVDDSDYADGMIADKGIADLNRLQEMERPFFLALGFHKPHLPFNAPKKYWDLYEPGDIRLANNPFQPQDAPDIAMHPWIELRKYMDMPRNGPMPDELAQQLVHGYYACVSYIDAQIGRVLKALEALGMKENTIVVLWGDHGWQLGEHGLWCKHCNFQTSLRAPLIIMTPGKGKGLKTSRLTEFVDIYPTLCDLANLDLPHSLEGTSLLPLMRDPNRPWKKAIFSRWQTGDSVRTERYLYTEWKTSTGNLYSRMLYDHLKDPEENVNIAEKRKNQGLVKELSDLLQQGWYPHQQQV